MSSNLPETDESLSRKIKQRRCIATQQVMKMEALTRFVLAPDGRLTPDLSGKLPGRGAYLTPTRAALAQATKARAFSRAFQGPVQIPNDFDIHIARLIHEHLMSRLSMARRSGDLALGKEAVFAAAQNAKLCLLILPYDASSNANAQLGGIARAFPSVKFSTTDALGQALGRPRVTNLAFTHPHKSEHFLGLVHKFRDFLDPKAHEPHL